MRRLVKLGWVGVEGREEGRYMWLPVVRPMWSSGSGGQAVEEGRAGGVLPGGGSGGHQQQSAFQGVGRTLGS